jgi:hypothetical protein
VPVIVVPIPRCEEFVGSTTQAVEALTQILPPFTADLPYGEAEQKISIFLGIESERNAIEFKNSTLSLLKVVTENAKGQSTHILHFF